MINDKGNIIFQSPWLKVHQDISPEWVEEVEKYFTADPFSP